MIFDPSFNVRQAYTEDVDNLVSLFDLYRIFYGKASDLVSARSFLRQRLTNAESEIFLAQASDGEVVGFTQLYPLFSSTQMKRLWLLNDLFVLASFRGRGLSVRLIDAAKDHCRKTDACGLMLETAMDNVVGNSLYPRAGFKMDREHNYYAWENESAQF